MDIYAIITEVSDQQLHAPLAQGIEQLPSKQWVGRSIRPGGATRYQSVAGVAQVVRAPGCGPGGRGFESHFSPQVYKAGYLSIAGFCYFLDMKIKSHVLGIIE